MPSGWRPSSPAVDAASLPLVLAGHPAVVLHFWAEWNAHDRSFDEQLREVRGEFGDRVYFGSVNSDDPTLGDFARQCRVVNLPALAFFVAGRRVETLIGYRSADQLREKLANWLSATDTPNPSRQRSRPAGAFFRLFKRLLGGSDR